MNYLEKIKDELFEKYIVEKKNLKSAAFVVYRFENYGVSVLVGKYRNGIEVGIVNFDNFTKGTFPMISCGNPILPKGTKENVTDLHNFLLNIKRYAEQEARQ